MPLSDDSPAGGGCGGEIVLFGVRVKEWDPLRKSVSMNNISDYVHLTDTTDPVEKSPRDRRGGSSGYASADDAVALPSGGGSDRKRGTPWTVEEHKRFLVGLQKVGKGNWRGISKNYVKTRSPTQVASHAQKYYLRRSNLNRHRRRSSLFDITTESVTACQKITAPPPPPVAAAPPPSNVNVFSARPYPVTMAPVLVAIQGGNPSENAAIGQDLVMNNSSAMVVRHVPVLSLPHPSSTANRSLNQKVPPDPSPWPLLFFQQPSKREIPA